MTRETCSHSGNLLLLHVLVNWLAILLQESREIIDELGDARRVFAEDRPPVSDKHHKHQAPEGIFLVGNHQKENAANEVHALAVAGLRVIRAVGF